MTNPKESIQPKLDFGDLSSTPVTMSLHLVGLTVVVDIWGGKFNEAWAYLRSVGVSLRVEENRGILFPVKDIHKLNNSPQQIKLLGQSALKPILQLALRSSEEYTPAMVICEKNRLFLTWSDQGENFKEPLTREGAIALLSTEMPAVFSPEAWVVLDGVTDRGPLGVARLHEDGYIVIETTKPQLLEASPLPGLFKLGNNTYGMSLVYRNMIDRVNGFYWKDDIKPSVDQNVGPVEESRLLLSKHHHNDLNKVVDHLVAYKGLALVWDQGLGRRIMALAAVDVLDAYPLLIVTPPSGVWAWQRHLDLVSRSGSLSHNRSDVRIITYLDLAASSDSLEAPNSIIFDDFVGEEAQSATSRRGLNGLAGFRDAYRIGIASQFPDSTASRCDALSLIRPSEFKTQTEEPLIARYASPSEERARIHIEAYLERRNDAEVGGADNFKRSQVKIVTLSKNQLEALNKLFEQSNIAQIDPLSALAEGLEIVSAGVSDEISPKITTAVSMTRELALSHKKVALVTNQRRSASLLKSLVLPSKAEVTDDSGNIKEILSRVDIVVVHYHKEIPDLSTADEVIIIDYPFSTELIEIAVGAAWADNGAKIVSILHANNSIDDRLAMFAAFRRELGVVVENSKPPTEQEAKWLMTARKL